jgi:hypothetical protein
MKDFCYERTLLFLQTTRLLLTCSIGLKINSVSITTILESLNIRIQIQFCISRDIPNSAIDVSSGTEPEAGSDLKPETNIYAELSSETPEKKKQMTDDKQGTSAAIEDESVESKTQGPTVASSEDTKSQTSRLNKKYEISLADGKYVFYMQYR